MSSRTLLARALAVATVIALVSAVSAYFGAAAPGVNPTAAAARGLAYSAIYLYAWAFLLPLLAPFFNRYPLVGKQWRRIPYYGFVGALAAAAQVGINRACAYLVWRRIYMSRGFGAEWFAGFFVFWLIAGVFQIVEARARVRDLQVRLARAELQNLKSQLHPHFLFNTLHTISVLMRQDPEAANAILVQLADLLRLSLDYARADHVPLQHELDFLETYLSIERARFQERLRTAIDADAEARGALVPALLLQPLVENAVRHGLAPRAAGGSLAISARRLSGTLELRVEDDGSGLSSDYLDRRSRGCGLRNTEGRLRALYGPAARFEVSARPGGGVTAFISLPYRTS